MSKLLGQQLKENIKDIFLWIIIPPILLFGLNTLTYFTDLQIVKTFLILSIVILYTSFAVDVFIIIVNDYNRFYGEKAAFYDVLPIKSSSVTSSRILSLFITILLIGVIAILELLIFLMVLNNFSIFEMISEIKNSLSKVPMDMIIVLILTFISSIIANISQVVFSITLGSDRIFKKFNKFGPIVAYILLSLLLTIFAIAFASHIVIDLNNDVIIDNISKLRNVLLKG